MALVSKTYGRILAILMAWFGFSCNDSTDNGDIMPEYGVPSATFKAKGVVTSQTDNSPIEGIRAVLKTKQEYPYGIDTVYTDNKGTFNLKSLNYEFAFNKLYVELSDVDGEENGSFLDTEIEIDYSKEKFKGGDGHWYAGEAEKDLENISMKPKE